MNELLAYYDANDHRITVFELNDICYFLNEEEKEIIASFGEYCESDIIDFLLKNENVEVVFTNLSKEYFEEELELLSNDQQAFIKQFLK